jgi:hypothetical protein
VKRLLVLIALVGPTLHAFPCSPTLPASLCALETRLYTSTEFTDTAAVRGAMLALKEAWMENERSGASLRAHLLTLVNRVTEEIYAVRYPEQIRESAAGQGNLFAVDRELRAYERKHGPIVPLDWSPPASLRVVMVTTERSSEPAKDRTGFRLSVFAGLDAPHAVKRLRLIRYPGEVVLDSATMGMLEGRLRKEKIPFLVLTSPSSSTPPPEGLYTLEAGMQDGTSFAGWFFLAKTTPSASPPILAPSLGQSFSTPFPNLRWSDFRSPGARAFEQRKFVVDVKSEGRGAEKSPRLQWSYSEMEPFLFRSVVMGKEKGSPPLPAGAFEFTLSAEERWLAGERLFIGRKISTRVPFRVSASR